MKITTMAGSGGLHVPSFYLKWSGGQPNKLLQRKDGSLLLLVSC